MDFCESAFRSIATCYAFLSKNTNQQTISLKAITALAESLKLLFTIDQLAHCAIIAPNLIKLEFNAKSSQFYIVFTYRKRKRNLLGLVDELCNVFKETFSNFKLQPNYEQVLEQKYNLFNQSDVYRGAAEIFPNHVPTMKNTKTLGHFEEILKYTDRISKTFNVPAKQPSFAAYSGLHSVEITRILEKLDRKLYTHQHKALQSIFSGENVVTTTSTSSGKSFIYQLAIQTTPGTSILIFPTKALSQDQQISIKKVVDKRVDLFDGDTPFTDRKEIIVNTRVLLTNPDMIHATMLPNHQQWKRFITDLKFVVVDELHAYHGEFGCQVSMVMKRHYGNDKIQIICCSATMPNTHQFATDFFGLDFTVIKHDCSGNGEKTMCIWKPPLRNTLKADGGYVSAQEDAGLIAHTLTTGGFKSIIFAKTRGMCEIIYKEIVDYFDTKNTACTLMSYRGGYSKQERREIERKLFSGELMGIVCTNALELGIDIGGLDAVVHVGFPNSMSSFLQQSGRAGRGLQPALDILLVDNYNSVDMTYYADPDLLFKFKLNDLLVDYEDESVLEVQLNCAARELMLKEGDFPHDFEKFTRYDSVQGGYVPALKYMDQPAKFNPLRAINQKGFLLLDQLGNIVEELESDRVGLTVYQDAIFVKKGKTFMIQKINFKEKYAQLAEVMVSYTTMPNSSVQLDVEQMEKRVTIDGTQLAVKLGTVHYKKEMHGYKKFDSKLRRVFQIVNIAEKNIIRRRYYGCWIDVPLDNVQLEKINHAVHSIQHLVMKLFPIYASTKNLKSKCPHEHQQCPKILFFSTKTIINTLVRYFGVIVYKSLELLSCECQDGCNHCIKYLGCTKDNFGLDKQYAKKMLEMMM
ncbi:hypothetical protein HDV01_000428 [Terramyces sp. JEL0728]|nr:hypothetical protein HDV01_000428 [Terramyces sp. JEL0728]